MFQALVAFCILENIFLLGMSTFCGIYCPINSHLLAWLFDYPNTSEWILENGIELLQIALQDQSVKILAQRLFLDL